MQQSTEFKLNSRVLFDKIEAIKKNPPPEIAEYKEAHPEFKTVNCALIAEYIGLSEKTLTNLKLGKLTDSNCSTVWLICNSLGIDLRDYFGIPRQSECNPDTCSSHAHARLDEKRQRITELEALCNDAGKQLVDLRTIINDQSAELGAANAKVGVLERLIAEKERLIAEKEHRIVSGGNGIRTRNIIICALGVTVAVALALAIYFIWEALYPYSGNFKV